MSPETSIPETAVLVLSVCGLVFAVLSALEERVKWVSAFCRWFGEGCRQTADYTMLGFPISWWGAAYYLVLAAAVLAAKPLVFWLVFAGLGFELTFVYILVVMRAFCIFCFLNAFVVALLAATVFEAAMTFPALTAVLACFIVSYFLIWNENRSRLAPERGPGPRRRNVLAVVDGKTVTAEEVERPISSRLHALELE